MRDIIYTEGTVLFDCMGCSKPLTIKKATPSSLMSGVFCPECDEPYWIRWSEGILTRGAITTPAQELAQKIIDAIEQCEQDIQADRYTTIANRLARLTAEIRQLCQEEVNKQ